MGMLAGEAQDARLMNHGANLVLPVRSCLIRLVPIKLARREAARRPFAIPLKQGPWFKRCDWVENLSWAGRNNDKKKVVWGRRHARAI